jgi:hypothetical protein
MLNIRSSRALHHFFITPPGLANRKSLFRDFVRATPKDMGGSFSLWGSSLPIW